MLQFLAVQMIYNVIRLPFLEVEPEPFVRVVFLVGLIFMIFDLDEVRIDGCGIKRERNKAGDGGAFGDKCKRPGLFDKS